MSPTLSLTNAKDDFSSCSLSFLFPLFGGPLRRRIAVFYFSSSVKKVVGEKEGKEEGMNLIGEIAFFLLFSTDNPPFPLSPPHVFLGTKKRDEEDILPFNVSALSSSPPFFSFFPSCVSSSSPFLASANCLVISQPPSLLPCPRRP